MEDLLAAGKEASVAGDRRTAHELYRAAAVVNPYDQRVWVALLEVLTRADDREVCLQNIVAIDPLNTEARRQLRAFRRERRLRREAEDANIAPLHQPKRGGGLLGRAILAGVGVGLLAVVLGVLASIVAYSGILANLGLVAR
jgi:hypothetical protein